MLTILKYLKRYKISILCIFVFLIIRAVCELSLPTYTSDIVDVGISNYGIEEKVPKDIRKTSLEDMKLFLSEEEAVFLDSCYEETNRKVKTQYSLIGAESIQELENYLHNADGISSLENVTEAAVSVDISQWMNRLKNKDVAQMVHQLQTRLGTVETPIYRLKDSLPKQDIKRLESLMEKPQMFYAIANSVTQNVEDGAYGTGILSEEKLQEMVEQLIWMLHPNTSNEQRKEILGSLLENYEVMWDTMSRSLTAIYIRDEYKAVGVDLEQYQKSYLIRTGLKMTGEAFVIMAMMFLTGLLASQIAAKVAMELRNKMFASVMGFSNKELDRFSTASLITRCTNDIQLIQTGIGLVLRFVLYAPIIGIGALMKVLSGDVSLAWIIGVSVFGIFCLVIVLFVIAMPKFEKMQFLIDKLNQVAREMLTGIQVIRAFSKEDYEEKRFEKANDDLMRTQLFTNRVMAVMMPAMMLIMYLTNILILWFGAKGIDAGKLQVGDMIAFITYTLQIIMAFLTLTAASIMLPRALVATHRIEEVINTVPEITDEKQVQTISEKQGVVTFEQVSFAYPQAEEYVLEDISFTAEPGKTTAIIGSAGSGKSTLVSLIPRFYEVTEGRILVDGVDIRQLSLKELHGMLGYVPQKGVLFSGTIESNIKFGNVDASDILMKEVAATAQAAEFIGEKYESPIAQGGSNVSGGQKQRLSIARAMAVGPKIYIFDDSFSALDFRTDAALRKALKDKTQNSTVILVAQRISTIMDADQILVLDEGRLVGKGTHQELLQHCEVYQQIADSQLSPEEIEKTMESGKLRNSTGKEEQQ